MKGRMMGHHVDGYDLQFTGRRSWKAQRSRDGKVIDIVPVTWTKDLRRVGDQQFLKVWFGNPGELEEYRARQKPYTVAVAQAKDWNARTLSFWKFDALYEVVSTGKLFDSRSIEVRIMAHLGGQIGLGEAPRKITRLSYNSDGWRKPTGDAKKLEVGGTYNQEYGFGHEDWLFRDEWTIAGWRYAFLQGVNKSLPRLVEAGEPLDVTLFTVQPDKRRRYVARIRDMECLSDAQADDALSEFKKRGWLDAMLHEIERAGGVPGALGNARFARHILNVRFRLENVTHFRNTAFVGSDDPVMNLNRYLLYEMPQLKAEISDERKARTGSEELPDPKSYRRASSGPVQVTPEHAEMQKRLMTELRTEFPKPTRIVREENFVDVLVETETDVYLYEIKSDLSPLTVLRQAIGQLLEYSYRRRYATQKSVHLVAVGRNSLTASATAYLYDLQQRYALPLEYRVVSIQKKSGQGSDK
jgi:hypothetical protein